jgi:hypothetical protein
MDDVAIASSLVIRAKIDESVLQPEAIRRE